VIKLLEGFEVTEAQYSSMVNLILRYNKEPDERYIELGFGALMCKFEFITVGIEKDGYAHS